ncbi:DUF1467 family protein [Ancylobacter sp. 6x-1]|uniref:DUF1467 family protein n=1 Tax=Ancylobacter crimeensis TaxID=2579147 RepID=A0ABT0D6R1_9HYPH|nr:DUF1467 family protein [Ancylobacter crimeensis]MCK0195638.1 DUF1467 family protein [Ancylobacter crimeensis]
MTFTVLSPTTYVAIYFIIWWTVIFAVLPFGVRSQREEGDVLEGSEPGAPVRPMLLRKAIAITIVSAVIVCALAYAIEGGWLRLDMFPMPFDTKE